MISFGAPHFTKNAFVVFTLCSVLTGGKAHAQTSTYPLGDVDQLLSEKYLELGASKMPGAFAIGTVGSTIVFSKGYGLANVELNVAMTEKHVVRIASISKTFTAVMVLKLMEEGQLELDDTVAKHWPDTHSLWKPLTIRQLLSHTSGLEPKIEPLFEHLMDDLTPLQIVNLYKDEPLIFTPGESFEYANMNYWLLGLLLEKITKASYADLIQVMIVNPRGLKQTRYGNLTDIVVNRAAGYSRSSSSGNLVNARYFSRSLGYSAGGIISTAADMALFYQHLSMGKVLSKNTLDLALTPVLLNDGSAGEYGLGWRIFDVQGMSVAGHGGTTMGYTSFIFWSNEDKIFSGVFSNRDFDGGEPQEEALALFKVLAN